MKAMMFKDSWTLNVNFLDIYGSCLRSATRCNVHRFAFLTTKSIMSRCDSDAPRDGLGVHKPLYMYISSLLTELLTSRCIKEFYQLIRRPMRTANWCSYYCVSFQQTDRQSNDIFISTFHRVWHFDDSQRNDEKFILSFWRSLRMQEFLCVPRVGMAALMAVLCVVRISLSWLNEWSVMLQMPFTAEFISNSKW